MQRHDYAIVRCVTYERAPEWSYGGEWVGGASCACVCIGKIKRNQLGATTVKRIATLTRMTDDGLDNFRLGSQTTWKI